MVDYVDDERFRQNIGNGDDTVIEYLRDAMAVYAENRLENQNRDLGGCRPRDPP